MVEHVVLLRLAANAEESDVDALEAALAGLKAEIPGIRSIVFGRNVSPEGLGQGFEQGFIVTFVDEAARDAYLPHPAHLAVVPLVQRIADEVLVFDLVRETA